jgi:hypothetical protein
VLAAGRQLLFGLKGHDHRITKNEGKEDTPHRRMYEERSLSGQCSTGAAQARIFESTVSLGLEIRTISLQIRQSSPDYPGMPTRLSDLLVRRGLFVHFTWISTVS